MKRSRSAVEVRSIHHADYCARAGLERVRQRLGCQIANKPRQRFPKTLAEFVSRFVAERRNCFGDISLRVANISGSRWGVDRLAAGVCDAEFGKQTTQHGKQLDQ